MTQFINDYEDYAEEARSYLQAPAGAKIARCIQIIKLGLQPGYKGGKASQQVLFGWELPKNLEVFDEEKGPQPYLIMNIYNLVLNEKSNFSIHLSGWLDGRKIKTDFNYFTLLGETCVLNIVHKGTEADANKLRARVSSISALTEEQTCPPQINPFKVLTFKKWSEEIFNSLPEWIQTKIKISPEYKQLQQPQAKVEFQKKKNPVDPFIKNPVEEAETEKIPPTSSPEVSTENDLPF